MQALQFQPRLAQRLRGLLGIALLLSCACAHADELGEINKLLRGGQFSAAMAKVDVALTQHPKDAQLRFVKGMIASEMGKSGEAIVIFQKLTEDYPELPEPYNNLAVLHAAAGQYDKARVALERAIRTSPAYATAHENLGDVYAKLASQSYDKAMQLLDANQTPAPKSRLAMVRTLGGGKGGAPSAMLASAAPVAPSAPAAAVSTPPATAPVKANVAAPVAPTAPLAVAAKPAVTPPLVAAAPVAKPVVAAAPPPVKAPAAPAPVAAPAVQLAKAEPVKAPIAKAEPVKPAPAKAADSDDKDDVLKATENWARAWSAQDMKGYLNAYASNFQTPRGQSRQAWAADRSARIEGKEHIKVTIEAPQVNINGNTATVKFRQQYVSDRLKTKSRKTLVLEKQGKQWLIKQEQSGG